MGEEKEVVYKLNPQETFPFRVGDIARMKKQHPCGSHEWEILRIGSDLKLRCLGCGHQIMTERRKIEKNVRSVRRKQQSMGTESHGDRLPGFLTKTDRRYEEGE